VVGIGAFGFVGRGDADIRRPVGFPACRIISVCFAVAVEKFRGPERGSRPCGLLLEQVPDLPPVDQVFGAEQRVVGGPFRRGARRLIGVVCPALFPLIPGLSATTGLGAANLFTCTVLGAQSSAISPFSSGGSLILGSCGNEEERSSLFNRLLFVATPISIGVAAIFNLIVSMVL